MNFKFRFITIILFLLTPYSFTYAQIIENHFTVNDMAITFDVYPANNDGCNVQLDPQAEIITTYEFNKCDGLNFEFVNFNFFETDGNNTPILPINISYCWGQVGDIENTCVFSDGTPNAGVFNLNPFQFLLNGSDNDFNPPQGLVETELVLMIGSLAAGGTVCLVTIELPPFDYSCPCIGYEVEILQEQLDCYFDVCGTRICEYQLSPAFYLNGEEVELPSDANFDWNIATDDGTTTYDTETVNLVVTNDQYGTILECVLADLEVSFFGDVCDVDNTICLYCNSDQGSCSGDIPRFRSDAVFQDCEADADGVIHCTYRMVVKPTSSTGFDVELGDVEWDINGELFYETDFLYTLSENESPLFYDLTGTIIVNGEECSFDVVGLLSCPTDSCEIEVPCDLPDEPTVEFSLINCNIDGCLDQCQYKAEALIDINEGCEIKWFSIDHLTNTTIQIGTGSEVFVCVPHLGKESIFYTIECEDSNCSTVSQTQEFFCNDILCGNECDPGLHVEILGCLFSPLDLPNEGCIISVKFEGCDETESPENAYWTDLITYRLRIFDLTNNLDLLDVVNIYSGPIEVNNYPPGGVFYPEGDYKARIQIFDDFLGNGGAIYEETINFSCSEEACNSENISIPGQTSNIRELDNPDVQLKELHVFPNPSNELINLTLSLGDDQPTHLSIINLHNQTVFETKITSSNMPQTLDISSLPQGVYFIKVDLGNGENISEKIIISR